MQEGMSKWINLVFALIVFGVVLFIFASQLNIDFDRVSGVLSIFIFIIAIFVVLYLVTRKYPSGLSRPSSGAKLTDFNRDIYSGLSNFETVETEVSQDGDDFDTILSVIKGVFNPEPVKSEEESENQLIQFLNERFPGKSLSRGHTSTGEKVDIVVDGTYSIYLAVIDNEGRLVSLMEQILKSKRDFGVVAVVLLDMNEVPEYTIEKYAGAYQKIGVKVVLKKCDFEDEDQEK